LGSGIPIRLVQTNMRRICTNAIAEMGAIHPDRPFQLNCDSECPGKWDEARMTQVLSNLLGNAVYHSYSSFPVTLTVRSVGNAVELVVHNVGTPIPPAMMPKLFEMLSQCESGAEAGLGLGLYIAKEIILAHKGTIDVRSSDDEGTSFIARIPHAPLNLITGREAARLPDSTRATATVG
jgi:signal transduction histidine kinase